jgi:hypothetical protein
MITDKNSNAMFSICPFHLTDGSTLEGIVMVISNSDADVHRIADMRRLFNVDQTVLERTPRDKIESIRIEWEGERGLGPVGIL